MRESQSELLEEDRIRKVRQTTRSNDRSKDSLGSRQALSQRSAGTAGSKGKCHGHSGETLKSVLKLRQKENTGSAKGSHKSDIKSKAPAIVTPGIMSSQTPGGGVGTDFYSSPRNLQNYLNSNLDEKVQPPKAKEGT